MSTRSETFYTIVLPHHTVPSFHNRVLDRGRRMYASTPWCVREEGGASGLPFNKSHYFQRFTALIPWASIIRPTPLTRYCSRCIFYIDVFSRLSRSPAPSVQALYPRKPLFLPLFCLGPWKRLTLCWKCLFPHCLSAARGGTESTANSYPNKSGFKKREVGVFSACFLSQK